MREGVEGEKAGGPSLIHVRYTGLVYKLCSALRSPFGPSIHHSFFFTRSSTLMTLKNPKFSVLFGLSNATTKNRSNLPSIAVTRHRIYERAALSERAEYVQPRTCVECGRRAGGGISGLRYALLLLSVFWSGTEPKKRYATRGRGQKCAVLALRNFWTFPILRDLQRQRSTVARRTHHKPGELR